MTGNPRTAEELFDPDSVKPDGADALLDRVNAGDPHQVRRSGTRAKIRELEGENDLREVLASPAGVRLVARIIEACGWSTPHFHPSNSVMSEIAGRRSIAWQLENWISDADVELWIAVRRQLESVRPKPKTSERRSRT
jgi:hypothetical protein